MAKRKRKKWAEMETFDHVFQPDFNQVFRQNFHLKGKWKKGFFKNNNPITLELGCGKGEYTVGLSRKYPDRNFIGIDIKGARIWKGAKTAHQENLSNVAFLRTHIEHIESFFEKNEIQEIWLTFPDPQLKKRRNKKRLTSSRFLNHYRNIISTNGCIHLKTDSEVMFDYTMNVIKHNNFRLLYATKDLYAEKNIDPVLTIQTFYEKQFREENITIKYLSFQLNHNETIQEPDLDA